MFQAHETIKIGQLEIRYVLEGEQSGGGLGVFEMVVPAGAKVPPPHSHGNVDEYMRVLEGCLRCTVDDKIRDVHAGEDAFTRRGSVHAFSNPFGAPARALVVLTPDIGRAYFQEIAEVVNAGGPPDPSKMIPIMAKYGLTPARPAAASAP